MNRLTEGEVLEKWSHIAMKVFPPQTEITPASPAEGWGAICVRWKAENDPAALSQRARGVDLRFPPEMLAGYLEADAERQVKWDARIEDALSEKLRDFDPYQGTTAEERVEEWLIAVDGPGAALAADNRRRWIDKTE